MITSLSPYVSSSSSIIVSPLSRITTTTYMTFSCIAFEIPFYVDVGDVAKIVP